MARKKKADLRFDYAYMAETITRLGLSAGYSIAELKTLLPRLGAEVKQYGKNELAVGQGDPAVWFGVVVEGNLQATIRSGDGERHLMRAVRPGEYVGLSLLYKPHATYPCDVFAFPSCTAIALKTEAVLAWRQDPASAPFFDMVAQQLSRALMVAWQKAAVVGRQKIEDRVMMYLQIRQAEDGTNEIRMPGSGDDFANYLDCNRSALSRVLSRLKEEGRILYTRSKITLVK